MANLDKYRTYADWLRENHLSHAHVIDAPEGRHCSVDCCATTLKALAKLKTNTARKDNLFISTLILVKVSLPERYPLSLLLRAHKLRAHKR